MDDQPPLPVINNLIVGSRLTPIKHRSVTPQKAIETLRSNSVTKRIQISQSVVEIQEPTVPTKYISRRKLLRRENANMVLLHQFLNKHSLNQSMRKLDIRSVSKPSFTDLDRESFLTYVQPKPIVSCSVRRTTENEKLSPIENIWINKVKKDLRTIVMDLFIKRIQLLDYLKPLEICLFHNTVIESEFLPISFMTFLVSKESYLRIEDEFLLLPLKDLPLHRLITFATCQFYGLHCDVSSFLL